MWWFSPGIALGADRLVPSQYATVQAAVDAATDGDRVVESAGTYPGDVNVDGVSLSILGQGSALTTLEGGAGVSLVTLTAGAAVTLEDLALTTAHARRCIELEASTVTLLRVRVHDCGAGTENGGGLEADDGSVVTIDASTFEDQLAARAPHVYFFGATLDVTDSTFLRGTGGDEGGVHLAGETSGVTIRRSTFQGNDAGVNGGALSGAGGDVLVEDCLFDANHAVGNGGALYFSSADRLTILGSRFTANVGDARGGAIDLTSVPELVVRRNVFCGNVAGTTSGGSIRVFDTGLGTDHRLANNVFLGDSAVANGAAVYVAASRLRLENNTVLSSSAGTDGGSIRLTNAVAGDLELVNNVVAGATGYAASVETGASVFASSYGDWWANLPGDYTGNPAFGPGATDLFVDPLLQRWTGDCDTDELWPAVGSPLVDAGDPAILDLDGSPSDLGAWGGPDPLCALISTWPDADGDGLGDPARAQRHCALPAGSVGNGRDCDDGDASVGAGATWYADADGDGQGDAASSVEACAAPADHVDNALDCDDGDGTAYDGAAEVCDGDDEDCDGLVDQDDPSVDLSTAGVWYPDADGDGYGTGTGELACTPPPGRVATGGDCDDADGDVHPGAVEVCGGIDEDCDGDVDDADPSLDDGGTTYADADGDGFGDPDAPTVACAPSPGTVADASDCDDARASVHPGAPERCNGLDDDCDGASDPACAAVPGRFIPHGCGCASGSGATPFVGLVMLALWRRR